MRLQRLTYVEFLKFFVVSHLSLLKEFAEGFPGGAVVENLPANAGDTGSILVWEDPTCRGTTRSVRHNC